MKCLVFFAGAILFAGCATGHSAQGQSADPTVPSTEVSHENQTVGSETPTAGQETGFEVELCGVWENASCGDRKYLRSIAFKKDGKFTAVDEVAPCPGHGECVSSGVLNWQGSWFGKERTIELKVNPVEGSKIPEQIPSIFVILSPSPLSIGEQDDNVVCPYRKRK
jgi:hypothetical protein